MLPFSRYRAQTRLFLAVQSNDQEIPPQPLTGSLQSFINMLRAFRVLCGKNGALMGK